MSDQPNDLKNTAVFLAELWTRIDEWWAKGCALDGEKLKDHFVMNFPVLQTIRAQMRIRMLGRLACDNGKVAAEIESAISQTANTAAGEIDLAAAERERDILRASLADGPGAQAEEIRRLHAAILADHRIDTMKIVCLCQEIIDSTKRRETRGIGTEICAEIARRILEELRAEAKP